jgi:two-component system chemotaxis response regulator CheY
MAIDRFMSVLVVDDHHTMIDILRDQLRQIGFVDVDEAHSGAEALNKLCAKRYELIISDWHMEPVTGLDLLKAVRGDPGLKQILFIMVTGESRAENVVAARKFGVNGYIVKPFNTPTLKDKIEAVLATRSSPLSERETLSASDASDAMRAPAVQLKFPGRFTSST